jgi:anti-sigma factor RsiW
LSRSSDLTCKELVEVITDYLEGVMSVDERQRFDEHLAVCPGCRNYVEQMRGTIQAVGALREDMLSPEARDTLLANFRDWRRPD